MGRMRVSRLGKRYKHYAREMDRFREWLVAGRSLRHVATWVLRGVSFEVDRGQALGVIGANGAGKSTLLKIIKGTTQPTEGEIEIEGRLAALDLGLGLHPDFSGRQNVFLMGALLGMRPFEIAQHIPEIESFAEIGRHIDEPVRTYSTGMQMRLAFSVATAVRPDILLIDEALAVGDAYFQQKCITRIRKFRDQGTTLLLVSHDPTAITTLCDHALLLDQGVLIREGSPRSVLEYYNAMIAKRTADYTIRQAEELGGLTSSTRSGDNRACIEQVTLFGSSGTTRVHAVGSTMIIRVDGRAAEVIEDLTVGISIRDRLGNEVFGTNTSHLAIPSPNLSRGASFRAEFTLTVNLGVGNYNLTAALHAGKVHLEGSYDWWDNVCVFQVIPGAEEPFVGCAFLQTSATLETLE